MRTYIGKVIFSRGLKNLGAQIIYSLLLALLLISNFTGVSQAQAAEEDPLVNSQSRPNVSGLENTFEALTFTDPEERLSSEPLSQVAPPSPLLNGLVAYWNMDETSGTTLSDSLGSKNGTLINGTTWDVNGKLSGGINLDGINDYVSLPHIPFDNKSYTISAWIKLDVLDSNRTWFSQQHSYIKNKLLHLRTYPDGKVRFGQYFNDLTTGPGILQVSTWHHVVYVYDYLASPKLRKIVVDPKSWTL